MLGRSRLPGVDPVEERDHALPHGLRRGAIVLGQVWIGEEVPRAWVDVLLELCPGSPDVLAERGYLLFGFHPGVIGGVMYLYRHPLGPAFDAEILGERLDGDGAVNEHRPEGTRPGGGQLLGVRDTHGKPGEYQSCGQPGDGFLRPPGDLSVSERFLFMHAIVEVVEHFTFEEVRRVNRVPGRPQPFGGAQHPRPEAQYRMEHNNLGHRNSSHQDTILSPQPFRKRVLSLRTSLRPPKESLRLRG